MKISSLLAALLLTLCNAQIVQADVISTYDVTTSFDDGSGITSGSFTYDSTSHTVTGVSGIQLYDSMGPTLSLNYLLPSPSQVYDTNGNLLVSVYLNDVATPYVESMTLGGDNAFATFDFNPNNPTSITSDNINQLVFMDCTPAADMSNCSTGNQYGGTMGTSIGETITLVSTVGTAPVPLPAAVWSFLVGTMGMLMLGKKRKSATSLNA